MNFEGAVGGGMTKRLIRHLLAIALILGVGAIGFHAVAHWHANAYDEQHCQICQVAHTAAPKPVVQAVVQGAVPIARFSPAKEPTPDLEDVPALSIPRAPPA